MHNFQIFKLELLKINFYACLLSLKINEWLFFISNIFQKSAKKTDNFSSIWVNYSQGGVFLVEADFCNFWSFWKFIKSLNSKKYSVQKKRSHISVIVILDVQVWSPDVYSNYSRILAVISWKERKFWGKNWKTVSPT